MAVLHKTGLLMLLKRGSAVLQCLNGSDSETNAGRFERLWRPVFGYAVSLTWVLHMLTVCHVVWSDNPRAPEIIMALVETTSLWSVALGVLGISVVRETPKAVRRKAAGKNKTRI